MKTAKKLIAALTVLVLVFVMVSCGAAGDDMTKEPKNAKEASAMHESPGAGKRNPLGKLRHLGKGLHGGG